MLQILLYAATPHPAIFTYCFTFVQPFIGSYHNTVRNLAKKIDKITRLLSLQVVAEEEGAELTDKSTRKVSFILLQLDELFSLDS